MKSKHLLLAILFVCALAHGQTVFVYLPDSITGAVGDTVQVPILISDQVGRGVISADITLSFRESVLTGTSVCRAGNAVPSGWMVYANPLPGQVLIAMAGANPLVAGDTLLVLKFLVDSADTTTIGFSRCSLNEGNVACSTRAGKFYPEVVGLEDMRLIPADRLGLELYPNPILRSAWVQCCLGTSGHVRLEICDVGGKPVRTLLDQVALRGELRVRWDCRDDRGMRVPTGVYFCRLEASEHREQKKVVLVR